MKMRMASHVVAVFLTFSAFCGAEPGMAEIRAAIYRPLFRGEMDAREVVIAAFQLDVQPVTNAEFLNFVRENPKWRRSQVKRLFADERYLVHWTGDLELGDA